jgi:Flp pilus assembly protein TadG
MSVDRFSKKPMLTSRFGDEAGSVLVEFAVLLPVIVIIVFGSVDLLYAFYQWNAAAKAVAIGARIAAVSDPVAAGLNGLSNRVVLSGLAVPRGQMPSFTVACDGDTATCACTGTCTGMAGNSYDATAMNRIVFGRGSLSCGDASSIYTTGMCDVLASIKPANVVVSYQQTGLGFAGRPGGPVPTITVALQKMTFQFFFLEALGIKIAMPAMTTTITAEDLCSSGASGSCGS